MTAKIIQDSINQQDVRITTFELEYPRFIHSEFMTHRQLSRNSASSRAIPIRVNIENILSDTAMPVSWGKNQPGMVADENLNKDAAKRAEKIWIDSSRQALSAAVSLNTMGVHKQIANRLIENFTYQKVVVTATEWDNFFWLRNHKDAQPEIKDLAEKMLKVYKLSVPTKLNPGEWHVPYVKRAWVSDKLYYMDSNREPISLEEALKISASCCAQVSYRKSDDSVEKANKVFDMLNLYDDSDETRKHASPVEHQATPITRFEYSMNCSNSSSWQLGVTHMDRAGNLWSGNFKEWVQHRQLIPNESYKNTPELK